jgi:hypothetical protein
VCRLRVDRDFNRILSAFAGERAAREILDSGLRAVIDRWMNRSCRHNNPPFCCRTLSALKRAEHPAAEYSDSERNMAEFLNRGLALPHCRCHPRDDRKAHPLYLDWLHRSEATLTFPLTIVVRNSEVEPEGRRLPQAANDCIQWFLSRLRHLTRALRDHEWLCAGRFTMADLYVGDALLFARNLNLASRFSPEIAGYWDRLTTRPGFIGAKAAQASAQ